MEKQLRLVSIIIPVYNGANVLERCLESIIAQSYSNLDVIVVNDGSTDESSCIIQKYVDKYEFIHLVTKENEGVSATRNRGIKEAYGDFILFVDCDDYLQEKYVEHMVHSMTKNEADIVIAGYTRHKYGKIDECKPEKNIYENKEDFSKDFYKLYNRWFLNTPWNKMFRRNMIESEFPMDISLGEDLIFNLEYLKKCNRIVVSDEVGYQYQIIQNSGSLAEKYREDRFENSLYLHKRVLDFAKNELGLVNEEQWQDEAFIKGIRFAMTNLMRAKDVDTKTQKEKISEWTKNDEVLAAYKRCKHISKQDQLFKLCICHGWDNLLRTIIKVIG